MSRVGVRGASEAALGARTPRAGLWGEPGLGGAGSARVGSAPKAGAEPGAHEWHGQGREGVKEEGAPPGPVPVIPGPLADSAVAAEKCPAAGAGGRAPGSPAPRCRGPAPTRGRGRVAVAPSGPGPRSLSTQRQLPPARNPRPQSPFPPAAPAPGDPSVPSAPGAHPAGDSSLGCSRCLRGLTCADPGAEGAPRRPPALTWAGVPRRQCFPRCPPGSHLGRGPRARGSPCHLPGLTWPGVPRRGSLGGGAPAAAPRLPHCLRCVPRPLLVPPASHPPRRSLPSPAPAAGRNTGHMLRGHKLGRSANTPVPGWLF